MATTGREDNIAEESMLAILPDCCFGFFNISLLSPTCWLWRRDSDEVDAGDDDQLKGREDNITEERMLAILPVCCLFFWLLSLWSPTCWLWQRDNDGGWWWDERTTLPKKVRCCFGFF